MMILLVLSTEEKEMEEIKRLLEPFELQAKPPKRKRKIFPKDEDNTGYSLNLLSPPEEPDTMYNSSNNSVLQEGTDPLPGFDREVTCSLCKIKCDRGMVSLRENTDGASFVEFLEVAQVILPIQLTSSHLYSGRIQKVQVQEAWTGTGL